MANVKPVKLGIITPDAVFYEGEVELVIVRTLTGEEGFMAGHSWACKLLDVGEIRLIEVGSNEPRLLAAARGFIDVRDDIIIFTDAAEWASDIDIDRAMNEKERFEHWLAQHNSPEEDQELITHARISIQKQTTRMKVAQGGSRRR